MTDKTGHGGRVGGQGHLNTQFSELFDRPFICSDIVSKMSLTYFCY